MKPISILILLISALLLAACQSATPQATAVSPAETTAPTAIPTPDEAQSRQAIIDGLLAMNDKPNRMEMTTIKDDGSTVVSVIESLPPDRKTLSSQGVEYIVAGGKVFMKVGQEGAWKEVAIPVSSFISTPTPTAESVGKTVSAEHVARKDTFNGKDVLVYGYTSTINYDGLSMVSQCELWVALTDGLPVKYVTKGDTYGVQVESDGTSKPVVTQTTNTTLIDFTVNLKIEPPL